MRMACVRLLAIGGCGGADAALEVGGVVAGDGAGVGGPDDLHCGGFGAGAEALCGIWFADEVEALVGAGGCGSAGLVGEEGGGELGERGAGEVGEVVGGGVAVLFGPGGVDAGLVAGAVD